MQNEKEKCFIEKFDALNEVNKNYIVAIQQALLFTQSLLVDDKAEIELDSHSPLAS